MSFVILRKSLIVVGLIGLSACTAIPPEAPELSVELGNRISAIESSNVVLLNRYFDQKRKEVDRFIDEEWVPTFASEFFRTPQIAQAWETIVRENDKTQRLMFIVKLGPKLQAKINAKRRELIQPLDELESTIEDNIRGEYAQARAINNSITSFLLSASEVAENRNRYLEFAGISEGGVTSIINRTDTIVADLLGKTRDVDEKVKSAEKYLDKLNELKNSL
ncbi:hypothetical protein K0I73_15320 [Shewanella mesophila]|uniref:hypothetical protein n=1 Tax=Shewanella mesophila TaxID=2864208 RepID=UPI001C6616A9|nr:hypothetical protein [Shewanella mesophila]QYJ85552.1 hypothetical protein K0I73_15320 [Shewanella mesophila]